MAYTKEQTREWLLLQCRYYNGEEDTPTSGRLNTTDDKSGVKKDKPELTINELLFWYGEYSSCTVENHLIYDKDCHKRLECALIFKYAKDGGQNMQESLILGKNHSEGLPKDLRRITEGSPMICKYAILADYFLPFCYRSLAPRFQAQIGTLQHSCGAIWA